MYDIIATSRQEQQNRKGGYNMEQLAGLIVLLILLGIVIELVSSLFRAGRKITRVLGYKLEEEYRKIESSSEKH